MSWSAKQHTAFEDERTRPVREDMILAARARLPQLHFALQDVTCWHDAGPFDVLLSNAVFQWLPAHDTLLPGLLRKLTPGGALAVQMPDNLDEPAPRLMLETAADGPWAEKLRNAATARAALHEANWYYPLLRAASSRVEIWRTTYYHHLGGGAAAVVEWFKGSGLRPFLQPLNGTERADFTQRYTAGVAQGYPPLSDGSGLLPMPRLFMVAIR